MKLSLQEIGLTEHEQEVYLALLKLGDTTRSELLKETHITGSKIYDVVNRLQEKGLASVYIHNGVKHFKALEPQQILRFLEDKQATIEEQKHDIKQQLPTLQELFESTQQEQEVELLTGLKAIRPYFEEQLKKLKKGDTCYVIGGTQGTNEETITTFFRNIHTQREHKGIITKMLYNKRQQQQVQQEYGSEEFPNTQTQFIDHSSAVAINIFNNDCLILLFGSNITGIRIRSTSIANSFTEYFNLLWN